MIASILKLSRADCKALNLKDLYGLHKAVYSLFPTKPGNSRDFLFVDKGGDWNSRHVLILSEREPVQPEFGEIVSKAVPDVFLQHDFFGFEVVLNPTRRDSKSRKIIPVRGRAQLIDWLVEKAPGFGFQVPAKSLQVNHIGVVTYRKNGTTRTHNTATFIGTLRVIDRAAFVESFQKGIGRAKGFGFGLLQLVPMQAQDNISAQ